MIRKISFKFAANAMLLLLICLLVYHVLIVTSLIPYDAVWGGRLEDQSQMYQFEAFSIAVNLLMLLVVCMKGRVVRIQISSRIINLLLWAFTLLYALNTVGNLLSTNMLERVVFTPLTLLAALFCFRLAVER